MIAWSEPWRGYMQYVMRCSAVHDEVQNVKARCSAVRDEVRYISGEVLCSM